MLKLKIIVNLGTIVIRQGNIEVLHIACNLKYSILKEIFIVFNNSFHSFLL